MSSYRNFLLGATMLAAACLPAVGAAAMVAPSASAVEARPLGLRLTGFARPRMLEVVPGSSSVGLATYAFKPLFLPVNLPTSALSMNASGSRATLLERNRTWNSGQHSFLRPQRGHHQSFEREDDIDDDLGEHGHGHGHGDGHGGSPVPLPAPWLMLVSGLLALVTARRVAAPQA